MEKKDNNDKKITVNLLSITIIITVAFVIGTIICIILKYSIEKLSKVDQIVLDCCIIIFPIIISVLGVSLFLEATSYRKVLRSEFAEALDALLTGEKQAEYLSKASYDQIFHALQMAYLRELVPNIDKQEIEPISVNLQNIVKQLINGIYIEKDKRDITIRITNNKIHKTIKRTQIFRNKYGIAGHNDFYISIECVEGSEINIKKFTINNKKVSTQLVSVPQYDVCSESSYSCRYEIHETLDTQDRNTVKMEMDYDIPLEDSTSYFVNRYLCKQLEHTITVMSDEPVDFEVNLFALNNNNEHNEDCKYYIDNIAQEENLKTNKKTRVVKFLDWSFPGDGYGFHIKK